MVGHKIRPCMQEHERLQMSCLLLQLSWTCNVIYHQRHQNRAFHNRLEPPTCFSLSWCWGGLFAVCLGCAQACSSTRHCTSRVLRKAASLSCSLVSLLLVRYFRMTLFPPSAGQTCYIRLAASMDKFSTSRTSCWQQVWTSVPLPGAMRLCQTGLYMLYRAFGCGAACQRLRTLEQCMASLCSMRAAGKMCVCKTDERTSCK